MPDPQSELDLHEIAARATTETRAFEAAMEGASASDAEPSPPLWTEDFAASGKAGKGPI